MKKKLVYFILGLMAASSMTMVFAGCNGNPDSVSSIPVSSATSSQGEDMDSSKPSSSPITSTVSTGLADDGTFVDPTGKIQVKIPKGYEMVSDLSTEALSTFQNTTDQTALTVKLESGVRAYDLSQKDFEDKLSMTYQNVKLENFKKEQKDDATSYSYKLVATSGTTKVQILQYTIYSPDKTVSISLAGPDTAIFSQDVFDSVVNSLQTLK